MRTDKIIFCILFFILIAVPTIGLLWYEEPEGTENKELATAPELMNDSGAFNALYLNELQDYYADHFAYRQEMVTSNAIISASVFAESSEPLAIVGNDGWLYLKASLGDYDGSRHMSARGLNNVAITLSLMQEYVEGQGKSFVFTCAPNKNTLYPENMPYYYTASDEPHDWELLIPYLDDRGVNYVDLLPLFRKQKECLYHKGDSHWNNKGAAMVFHELMTDIGYEHTDYTKLEASKVYDFEGDIDKILYPLNRHTEMEYDYSAHMNYRFEGEADVEAASVKTNRADKTGRLLCLRDSFGNSLLQFFANEFNQATFVKSLPYHLDDGNYDVCIFEIVERNLAYIKTFAPVFPAPLRSAEGEENRYESKDVCCEYKVSGDYYKIKGKVDKAYTSDDSYIYLRFRSENSEYIVEASPVFEPTKGSDESQDEVLNEDYGFVAYVYTQAFVAGEYEIEVITKNEGINVCSTGVKIDF